MHYHYGEVVDEEVLKREKLNFKILYRLLPFLKKYLSKFIILNLLLLLATGVSLLTPLLIKRAIDVNIAQRSFSGLLLTVAFYIILSLFSYFIGFWQRVGVTKVGERVASDLKIRLFSHLLEAPITLFDKTPVGKLITRNESDIEQLKLIFTSTALVFFQDLVFLIGVSIVMILVNPILYFAILILFPIFFFAFYWFSKRIRPIYLNIRKKIAEINNLISETIQGLFIIQTFNKGGYFLKKMENLGREKYKEEIRGMAHWYRVWFLVDFGEILALALVLGIGTILALQGKTTIGTLVLFFQYIIRLFAPLRGLSDQLNTIQRVLASAERVFALLDTEKEKSGKIQIPQFTLNNSLNFIDINFAYTTDLPVLKNINFSVRRGEKIALVGETGSGKTTIVNLLLRYYEPTSGKIVIDDINSQELDKENLRKIIGYVPQDVILFPGSVLENLRLFDQRIPEEMVYNAARQLKIYDRIMELPEGFKTDILERGINLSLGERQLLSFARALVFDPKILILDEATSSVDPYTERLIQEGLALLWQGRTVIVIAHRLSTIRNTSRILVLHKGEIVEEGTHDELIKKQGYYSKLYRLQYVG